MVSQFISSPQHITFQCLCGPSPSRKEVQVFFIQLTIHIFPVSHQNVCQWTHSWILHFLRASLWLGERLQRLQLTVKYSWTLTVAPCRPTSPGPPGEPGYPLDKDRTDRYERKSHCLKILTQYSLSTLPFQVCKSQKTTIELDSLKFNQLKIKQESIPAKV